MISSGASVALAVKHMHELVDIRSNHSEGTLWYKDFDFMTVDLLHEFQAIIDKTPRIHRHVSYSATFGDFPRVVRVYLMPHDYPLHKWRAGDTEICPQDSPLAAVASERKRRRTKQGKRKGKRDEDDDADYLPQ